MKRLAISSAALGGLLLALLVALPSESRPTVIGNGLVTDGGIARLYSDSSGTPGNATINLHCGRSAIAAGASAATITNSMVAATSFVFVQVESADATLGTLVPAPGAGTFTVTNRAGGVATNVTAATTFSWCVTPVF